MKTSHESRPVLLCRVVHGWSMIAGDPTTGAAARHVASCAACQEYFAASTQLEARLRAAAPGRAQPLPVGFEQRLERALASATRKPAPAESGSRWVLWSFLGSVAAAAAVVFVLLRPVDTPRQETQLFASSQGVNSATAPSSGAIILQSISEDPLQREIDDVYSDARAALRFLALNFLPASATDAPSS